MKKNLKKWIAMFAVAVMLVTGVAAFAETADQPENVPAEQTETTTDEATTEAATETTTVTSEDTLYQEALTQYRKARQENCLNDLKAELDQMVANGQLTQEQADILLSRTQERMNATKADRGLAGRGLMGGRGGRGFGRR